MTSVGSALIAIALICSAHGANAMPIPSPAHFGVSADASFMLVPVPLCNGISKHTRTICCGTRPPAWCGKPQGATEVNANSIHKDAPLGPITGKSDSGVMFILGDPMLYVCLIACVTIIYLVALAGSGRDQGVEDAV
jgi:hypothetical protein